MQASGNTLDLPRLFAALPARILVLRADAPRFTILAATDAYLEASGKRLEDLLGQGIFEVFPESHEGKDNDGPGLLRASLTRVQTQGVVDQLPMLRYDVRHASGDGWEERYWTPINSPVFDARGQLSCILHRVEDATEFVRSSQASDVQRNQQASLQLRLQDTEASLLRHGRELLRSNQQLAESEHRVRALLGNLPAMVYRVQSSPPWHFEYLSEGVERLCGYPASYFLEQAHPWESVMLPEDVPLVAETLAAQSASGKPMVVEYRIRHRDGSIRWVEGRVRPGDQGAPVFEGTVFDITDRHQALDDLAVSEQRLRSLIENMPAMVFRSEARPPWRVIYASEGIERLSGYPASYFVDGGRAWSSIIHPEDLPRAEAEIVSQMDAGLPLSSEYRILRRDGSVHWVEGRARPTPGSAQWFDGTVFDIDERKRAELALAESQEHLRYTTQSVSSGVWTALPDGRIDSVSDGGRSYLGSAPQQREGWGWLDYVHPEDVERVRARWQHSLDTGELYECSFRQRDLSGAYHWLQARAICRRDAAGNFVRWYGITTDVGELVRMQEQLRESEELARATIQNVPGIVWRARADGTLNFVSDACTDALGFTPQEMLEGRWHSLIHPDDVADVRRRWRQALSSGERFESRHRFRNAQGFYRWFQFGAIATHDDKGRVARWHGLATDIEDLLQARLDAESATRAKSVFLSTMSHEIRTPLNAVLGFSGLLADTELDSQQRDFLSSIQASGDHLLVVINDILDYSKLESGSLSLEFSSCDLRELIEAALDIVASQAGPKNLELLYRIEADVPPCCRADPTRLRQVLVNLLGNAVKFTPSGEVLVQVSAHPLANNEYEFEFRVRDTGIGIAADQIGRLFRDFSQVDDSVARRFGGTGLGLAISKRLVEAHGGTITVESQVGVGSTFIVRIPAQVSVSPVASPDPRLENLRGRRVLVVDDNLSHLDFLALQLRAWGMDPVCVQEPRRALEVLQGALAQDRGFDLALVDQHMPELDGLELSRLAQDILPMPIVLMSSLGTTLQGAQAAGAAIAVVQNKPVHRDVLLQTLSTLLAPKPRPASEPGTQPVAMPALRLLLVEDNLVNRKVALLLLRKIGYEAVDVAVNGIEAIEAVSRKDYDVVLMDVQMPVLDGLGATRRIRGEIAAARQPAIIAMTANALIEDREACMAAGMDHYIAKPIVPTQLADALLDAAHRRGIGVALPGTDPRPTASQEADTRAYHIASQVLAGGGEMGALMRTIDWSKNPLGPVYTWPQSLRTVLSIVLTQKHPMFLWWGRELIQFYNDAYRPILGSIKHPRAMGQRGLECWGDIWDSIGPLVSGALERGESTMVDHGLLCLFRNGYYEEGYYSYGYSPIRDETGGIGGVLVACSENTAEVLGARRSALLLDVDEQIARLGDGRCDGSQALSVLEAARNDLPFLLMYRIAEDERQAELICSLGLAAGDPAAPSILRADDPLWPVFACARDQREILREHLDILPVLPPWPEPPQRALLVPASKREVVIAGLSARLPFDAAYNAFLTKLTARLGAFARHWHRH